MKDCLLWEYYNSIIYFSITGGKSFVIMSYMEDTFEDQEIVVRRKLTKLTLKYDKYHSATRIFTPIVDMDAEGFVLCQANVFNIAIKQHLWDILGSQVGTTSTSSSICPITSVLVHQ